MVLADRNAENIVRNGRRSRGPSPNGHSAVLAAGGITESSSDDENSRKNGNSSKETKKKSEYEEKIRVGRDYQAVCPELIPAPERKPETLNDRALLVWSPTKEIPDPKLEEYITVAKEKYGYNGEQALGMLFWHKHDLERAVLDLANFTPFPDEWTVEDKVLFEQAFQFHGKSFHRIRQMLPDKSIASLVKFYYSWKKTRSRTSVMDRQEKMKKNDSSENGSDHGSNEDSDNDDKTCGSSKRGYNYGMIYEMTKRMARALLSQKGCAMREKEVVGILLPNIPEFVPAIHGSLLAGLTTTFANPLYTPEEICRQFEIAGVRLVITLPVLLPVAQIYKSKAKKYRGTISIGGRHSVGENIFGFEELLREDHRVELPMVDPEDTAILPFSSGTTGMPKGVELSHNNLVANLAQGSHPEMNKYNRPEYAGYTETILTIPPFFHIYGFNGILNSCIKSRNHLVSIPRFIPEDYIQCLVEFRPKFLFVVPSLMLFLATHPKVTQDHLSSVDAVLVGAAAAPLQLQDKFKQKCGKDVDITQGYGMTESSPVTLCTPYKYDLAKVGTCGQLYPNTQAKIVSLTDGSNLGPHQPGELYIRGPQVMKGYLNNEQATRETVDSDGWLHTGDVAYYDQDGYFFIVDRTKELIKVKGNQVSPTELENLILELAEVSDVAVAGIADETAGELPRAYVVLKQGQCLKEQSIMDHVKERVVKYKQLAGGVMFVKEIPRNAGGKVLRHQLHLLGAQLDD